MYCMQKSKFASMHPSMDVLMHVRMYVCMHGWLGGMMDGCIEYSRFCTWMRGRVHAWVHGCVVGWVDGWMYVCKCMDASTCEAGVEKVHGLGVPPRPALGGGPFFFRSLWRLHFLGQITVVPSGKAVANKHKNSTETLQKQPCNRQQLKRGSVLKD